MTAAASGSAPNAGRRNQSWRQTPQHRQQVNDYARDRYQQQQAGTWAPFTPTGPVRDHVEQLIEAGMTREQIVRAAGISISTLTRVFRVERMSTSAADAVTSVQPPQPNSRPTPSRQLQALIADGWHLEQLAETAGINHRTAWQVVHGYVTPSPRTTAAIDRLYEDLKWEDPGDDAAAVRSRLRAHRCGWTTDPERTDTVGDEAPPATTASRTAAVDPAVDGWVDEVAVDRVVAGDPEHLPAHLRPEEQLAALRRLAGTLTDRDIADRLGVSTRTVLRHRTSQGLPAYTTASTAEPAHRSMG